MTRALALIGKRARDRKGRPIIRYYAPGSIRIVQLVTRHRGDARLYDWAEEDWGLAE